MANTPLRGRYLVRNPLWNWWLRVSDWALGFGLWGLSFGLSESREPRAESRKLKAQSRILLAVGGHIGDAVIATSALAELARRIPGVEIGVLCASWNRVVFEGHPLVTRIHVVDHWKLSREHGGLISRFLRTRKTQRSALREIRAVGYGAAIDLASHYPNSASLLHSAGISVRIGYESGGRGPLYTTALPWTPAGHVVNEHQRLLDELMPAADGSRLTVELRYDLAKPSPHLMASLRERFAVLRGEYVVVHPGAGNERKEWPHEKWLELVRELCDSGAAVVITGAGGAHAAAAWSLADAVPGVVSLVDRLSWDEFRGVIAAARAVVSVDTVAMHLAAAGGTPCVALMTGMDRADRWRPLGTTSTVLSHPVACSPCFLSRGCDVMTCVRQVEVRAVRRALETLVAEPSR